MNFTKKFFDEINRLIDEIDFNDLDYMCITSKYTTKLRLSKQPKESQDTFEARLRAIKRV